MKEIGAAIQLYAYSHNDTYPSAENWCDVLINESIIKEPKVFLCPVHDIKEGRSSYALNINIAGKKGSQIKRDTVLLFETTPGNNPAGGLEILVSKKHCKGRKCGCNILFADGHAEFIETEKDLPNLRWTIEDTNNSAVKD